MKQKRKVKPLSEERKQKLREATERLAAVKNHAAQSAGCPEAGLSALIAVTLVILGLYAKPKPRHGGGRRRRSAKQQSRRTSWKAFAELRRGVD